ncbi:LytTR family DNA-binding domain-containing protein [Nibrella saemangeumensis]|uniref:LytTR family DNA-binding domain-containing protein n=1 Tax=Nibrella saemangeumensis TaxID=1084526 RepID=A0ABP8NHU5_9BACT
MNVLIIEDEPLAVDRLRQLLAQIDPTLQIAGVTDSVEASVAWLRSQPKPDFILMDIELSDGQSFSIFEQVTVNSPVIFTTSYDEYAIRAFKVNSIDYLLKPIKIEDLQAALVKFRNLSSHLPPGPSLRLEELLIQLRQPVKEYRDRFLVKVGQRFFSIEVDDIAYFYYHDRITFLKTWKKEVYCLDYILDELEGMLYPKAFFRANRQYLLHVKSVKDIHTYFSGKLKLTLQPPAEEEVLVSRERAGEFKNWMGR